MIEKRVQVEQLKQNAKLVKRNGNKTNWTNESDSGVFLRSERKERYVNVKGRGRDTYLVVRFRIQNWGLY